MMGIPKTTRIILIVILLHASFCLRVNGQPDKRVITLEARQIAIDQIIKQIRQQTGVEFRYVPDDRFQRRLNVNFVNTRLDDVLAFVLNGAGLTWIAENGGISIINASPSAKPPISRPKPVPVPADTPLITGKFLDEAVIIGYGTTTQRFNTGNVVSVKGDTAYGRAVNNVLLLLQGRVAGMMVTQTSGMPGTELKVQLRGQTSLLNGTEPLFIVDGIPYNSILTKGLGSQIWSEKASSFGFINPDDIASIDVLKDADATAIYGSRGANGVVLITTKRGRPGKISTKINASQGFAQVSRHVPLLNTPQYLEMRREAFRNDNVTTTDKNAPDLMKWDTGRYTDWQKELIGNAASVTNLQASVSGGAPLAQFLLSGHYRNEQTVFPGPFKNSQAGMHFSLSSAAPGKRFSGALTGSFFTINSKLPGHDFTAQIMLPPNAPPAYLENGSLNYDWLNPYIGLVGPLFNSNIKNLLGSLSLEYEILPRLKLKTNIGYHWLLGNSSTIIPIAIYAPVLRPNKTGSWSGNDFKSVSGIIEPQVTYHTCLGKLGLEAVAGGTFQGYEVKREELTALGYKRDDQLGNLEDAESLSRQFFRSSYRYVAVFGRTKFKWKNRYLLNLSVRRDGSSRYGPRKQFAFFYAAGAGWIFSSERFMAPLERVLSFGKLRASFGTTGNDQIGDYQYLDRYDNVGGTYQGIIGLLPVNLYNADFAWEQTRKAEVGLETGFLKNRLLLSASYYNYRSTNQLVDYPLPDINGASSIIGNLPAVIRNTGWEFVLTGHHLKKKNFEWSSVFNISFARNKLIAYPDPGIGTKGRLQEMLGHPLSKNLVLEFRGVDPTTGTYTYTNEQGNPGPEETAVRKVAVNTAPDFLGGWENNLRYHRFQLDMLFQFVKQQGINDMYDPQYMPGFQRNQYINVMDRWQQQGNVAAYQRFTQSGRIRNGYQAIFRSDRGYVDASYIRCKYLNLSWQLPARTLKQLRLDNARLYIQAHNLFTITGYQGLDPETQSGTVLPPLRVMAAGIQLTL